jgi:hypothetical protein
MGVQLRISVHLGVQVYNSYIFRIRTVRRAMYVAPEGVSFCVENISACIPWFEDELGVATSDQHAADFEDFAAASLFAQRELPDTHMDLKPGMKAPESGAYQSLNVFGSPFGRYWVMTEGQILPALPIGWSWRLAGAQTCG